MDTRERILLNVAKDLRAKRGELPSNIGAADWAHLSAAVAAYGDRVEWRNADELEEHGADWMLDEEDPATLIPFGAHAADHDGGNMRIGRVVFFEAKGSIRIGQVVGIRSNGKTVGDVPDTGTEDGLNVKVNTAGDTFWVSRGQAHRVSECSGIGSATVKLLEVPLGVNAEGEPLVGAQEPAGLEPA